MKIKIIIALVSTSLFLARCSTLPPNEPAKQLENTNEQKLSFTAQINQSLDKGFTVEEIDNPNLTLPSGIDAGQIKKYLKIDNILLALVLRNSMNVVLTLPTDFTPTFSGVLAANQGDVQWTKLIEIKDVEVTNKNNPYYLMVDDQKLLLTIVDQNGAGSGEGMMKVFALAETSNWKLESCYYFGGNYNDPSTDGDYFAFSTNLSKQTPQSIESCNNVQLVSNE